MSPCRRQRKKVKISAREGSKKRLEVRLEGETVWLKQKQMALLFDKDLRTVNEHIKNLYEEKELNEKPNIRKFRIVQKEGRGTVEKNIDFYNLDVIISVGYRVKLLRGNSIPHLGNKCFATAPGRELHHK
jgi:hypothetical protein